jgi:hypothetical protein
VADTEESDHADEPDAGRRQQGRITFRYVSQSRSIPKGKKMRSVHNLFNLVQDGNIKTVEEARAIIAEEVADRMNMTGQSEEEARAILLSNIGYCTGYCDRKFADKLMELYETEHPIFGKTHPSAEEALRLGIEHGKKSLEKRGQLGDPDKTHEV